MENQDVKVSDETKEIYDETTTLLCQMKKMKKMNEMKKINERNSEREKRFAKGFNRQLKNQIINFKNNKNIYICFIRNSSNNLVYSTTDIEYANDDSNLSMDMNCVKKFLNNFLKVNNLKAQFIENNNDRITIVLRF